jgi:hypothetical protein
VKHYYSDSGILQHEWKDRALLVKLAEGLTKESFEVSEARANARSKVMEYTCSVIHSHSIHESMAGLGGCSFVGDWRTEKLSDPVEDALKDLFFEFIDAGYIPGEFRLAAWDAVCEVQITYLL